MLSFSVHIPPSIRLVVLESGLKSIFAGLGLGQKRLGLETICYQVHFQFSLCTFAVFCLGRMIFCRLASYTQPKISVTYLIFTAEFTHRLVACSAACSSSVNKGRHTAIYIVLIFLLLVHAAIKDLDLELLDLDSDLKLIGLDSDLKLIG